ncbi:hypothetical protein OTU49_001434 [Cherax quadricarinatus]|uniref:Ig-like domain-containing protein n=1 Tax=Cherax quadricarinatus TaxID=27406 RepID=A0AAW0XZN1_CHEQU
MMVGTAEVEMDATINSHTSLCLLLLLFITNVADIVAGLHITKVTVPTPVAVGEGGWLECEFVDEGESIYALKWYLGLDEIYRWTPAENPPIKTFPVKGDPLTVDTAASNRGKVRINDVTLGASGVFRCEVSAEAPDFHTESEVATMTVVDLPDEDPRISGVGSNHQLHQEVLVNCSSPRSQPPASLTFYVNQELVTSLPSTTSRPGLVNPLFSRGGPRDGSGNCGLGSALCASAQTTASERQRLRQVHGFHFQRLLPEH